MNENKLKITYISEEKESSDGRKYKTVQFTPHRTDGVLGTGKPRTRNVWEEGPNGSTGDSIYSVMKVGSIVEGSIQSIETEPYYIPNEYGKYIDPETNQPANKVDRYTAVVFADESIASIARSQGRTLKGEELSETLNEQVNEELFEEVVS